MVIICYMNIDRIVAQYEEFKGYWSFTDEWVFLLGK